MTESHHHPSHRILRSIPSPGAPPGTVVRVGAHKPEHLTLSLIDYTMDVINEIEDTTVEECFDVITGPALYEHRFAKITEWLVNAASAED